MSRQKRSRLRQEGSLPEVMALREGREGAHRLKNADGPETLASLPMR